MKNSDLIFVAGHRGLVGSAVVRALTACGHEKILVRSRAELNLMDQQAVQEFFSTEKPSIVIDAAARVGGIRDNSERPAEFIYDNLTIQNNIIHAAHLSKVKKLIFLGSSCIYPREAPQPIQESALLTGPLEPTNRAYALAKIAGIELCDSYRRQYGDDFISLMPTNLYGPNDNFDLKTSHVLPALIRKFHEAKLGNLSNVTLWGSGNPRREFLHVDDLAQAILFLLRQVNPPSLTNVGWGKDISIRELAELIKEIVGYEGKINWDTSMPDGTPRKLLNTETITNLGWRPNISLRDGVTATHKWFVENFTATKLESSRK